MELRPRWDTVVTVIWIRVVASSEVTTRWPRRTRDRMAFRTWNILFLQNLQWEKHIFLHDFIVHLERFPKKFRNIETRKREQRRQTVLFPQKKPTSRDVSNLSCCATLSITTTNCFEGRSRVSYASEGDSVLFNCRREEKLSGLFHEKCLSRTNFREKVNYVKGLANSILFAICRSKIPYSH